jgi:hypothetical protein
VSIHAVIPGFGQSPDQSSYPLDEAALDFLVNPAKEFSNWGLEENLVRQQRLKIRVLLETLVTGDACSAFGTEQKCDLILRKPGSFPTRMQIIWELG